MKSLPVTEPAVPGAQTLPGYGAGDTLDVRTVLDVLKRRRVVLIQAFVVVLVVGITGALLSPTIYEASAKLLVPPVSSAIPFVNASDPLAQIMAYQQPDSVSAQAQVLQSAAFLDDAKEQARVQVRRGVAPPSVKVQVLKDGNVLSNVVGVSVRGGDPKEITRLANTIVDLHLTRTDEIQNKALLKTIEDVRDEREKAQGRLAEATKALLEFRRTHNAERLTAVQKARGEQLVALQTQRDQAQGEIASAEAQLDHLKRRLKAEPGDGRADP